MRRLKQIVFQKWFRFLSRRECERDCSLFSFCRWLENQKANWGELCSTYVWSTKIFHGHLLLPGECFAHFSYYFDFCFPSRPVVQSSLSLYDDNPYCNFSFVEVEVFCLNFGTIVEEESRLLFQKKYPPLIFPSCCFCLLILFLTSFLCIDVVRKEEFPLEVF